MKTHQAFETSHPSTLPKLPSRLEQDGWWFDERQPPFNGKPAIERSGSGFSKQSFIEEAAT